ncbi:hypothetical protein KIN20_018978 [Parelaphostrongylus tenuis]|uniref:Uncharacterized protein n=1 Tax=Parelaphostrongylus tenuis TaxID=148309 RepID=A0AAD5N846_PARTN|nr:hypothetical protein KIN20_018978 [Parelaphostrongylus tenuis]
METRNVKPVTTKFLVLAVTKFRRICNEKMDYYQRSKKIRSTIPKNCELFLVTLDSTMAELMYKKVTMEALLGSRNTSSYSSAEEQLM